MRDARPTQEPKPAEARRAASTRSTFWIAMALSAPLSRSVAEALERAPDATLAATGVAAVGLAAILCMRLSGRDGSTLWSFWAAVLLVGVAGEGVALLAGSVLGAVGAFVSLGLCLPAAALGAGSMAVAAPTLSGVRRQAAFWAALLLSCAVGASAPLVVDEASGFAGPGLASVAIAAGVVLARPVIGPTVAFWLGCVIVRPLGRALGDLLGGDVRDGGFGFGQTTTNAMVLALLVLAIGYNALAVGQNATGSRDPGPRPGRPDDSGRGAFSARPKVE
jgi:uncharacterized membrane-anchored protein